MRARVILVAMWGLFVVVVTVVVVGACGNPAPKLIGEPCSSSSECDDGLVCDTGVLPAVCALNVTRADAATVDAPGAPDARIDAPPGTPDAAIDARPPDAAIPDAAVPDAAVPDAAVPDAAVPDAV